MSGCTADKGEGALHKESVGPYTQCYSEWGCLWSVIYRDIRNSMPKIQQHQTTTAKSQNTCLKERITHNIRFSYVAGPAGLQNPLLLWAQKTTRETS